MKENKPGMDPRAEVKGHQGRLLNHTLTQMDTVAHPDA